MAIAYNISDKTITFFAKGRPWAISAGNANFNDVKTALVTGPAVAGDGDPADAEAAYIEHLISLVDPKSAIVKAGEGKLEFGDGDVILYNGEPLHGVWVDKILRFRAEGIPFDPVFRALSDLQTNPTPEAIERLPIFLERVQSGFLPDGRCTAFKSVTNDYMDHHTHTFDNSVGQTVKEDRAVVNPDPNQTCSRGLHVGAMEYVKDFGLTYGRLMFVAFWPHDVVAVPTDYNGTKMRICEYEVLAEVDKNFYQDFISGRRARVDGYSSATSDLRNSTAPAPVVGDKETAFRALKVGDWIRTAFSEAVEVIALKGDDGDNDVVRVRDEVGDVAEVGLTSTDSFEAVVSAPPFAEQATINCQIELKDHPFIKDGWYEVVYIDDGGDDRRCEISVGEEHDEIYVNDKYIVGVKHKDLDLS